MMLENKSESLKAQIAKVQAEGAYADATTHSNHP